MCFLSSDLVHRNVASRMEQERGTGHGAGNETSAHLHATVRSVHHHGPVGDGPAAEGAGVLLREHELYESLFEDCSALLQK